MTRSTKARSRRFQNLPFGLRQLKSLVFRSPKVYEHKPFERTFKGSWARVRYLKAKKSGECGKKQLTGYGVVAYILWV